MAQELRRLAAALFRSEPLGHTLQPTALVGELWVRLLKSGRTGFASEAEFYTWATTVMRRALIDHARRRRARRRAGAVHRLDDAGEVPASENGREDVWDDLEAALSELAEADPRSARIVEMRFYLGMEVEAIATVLGVSSRTVRSDFAVARAWLRQRLSETRDGRRQVSAGSEHRGTGD
ncbi:MAG: ECF-type sigma factor [Planctomycetota bacterium]|nr:ECF-type sigma factor [Planctomycetota bacterium]